ncbi:MAG: amino acid ABC transporter substrate-binding protein [Gammaproteobacteria bacterium]|nr:amino acid ABC transporter substrate-binding protein [Gammaproteobacteria bacterium]
MNRGIILWIILSCFSVALHSETFNIVGDDDFPPFSFVDQKGQITGIDVELLNEMAKRLHITINISLVPWKRLLHMTKSGAAKGSFALFKTPERENFALFTHPVHYSTYNLFTDKNKTFKFETIKDLYGKRIGINAGFVISQEFDGASARGDINLIEIYNYDDAFRRLHLGGIDAFVGNVLVVKYKVKNDSMKHKGISNIVNLPTPLKQSRGAFFVLSKASSLTGKSKWQAEIKSVLNALEHDGTVDKIIGKYISK